MAGPVLQVEILTQQRPVLRAAITGLTALGTDGRFGILAGHEPFVFGLEPGVLELFYPDGGGERFVVGEGVLVVRPEGATILVRSAERPGDIDEERARRARERAERRLGERRDDAAAEMALKRAVARLKARHPAI